MIFLQDFTTKYPTDNINKKPQIKQIIIASNLNNKNFSSIYSNKDFSKVNSMSFHLLERFYLFKNIFNQTPTIIQSNKSIANWNVRKGMDNGVLLTLRKSNPFYSYFILNIFPEITQHDIKLSFKNHKDPFTSNFGLTSLNFFELSFSQDPQMEQIQNLIKNHLEFIGLRFHVSTDFYAVDNLKNKHKFILNYNKFY
jgi:ribosomal protein L5